jgi:hypothetical protein
VGGEDRSAPATLQSLDDSDAPAATDAPGDGNMTLPPPAVENPGPAIRRFDQAFDLTLTGTKLSAESIQINLENNCVNFGKGSVWLVFNGTATATWSSTTPLDQQLAIQIWDGGGQALLFDNQGSASPSTLDYDQFRITQATTLGFAFIVQPMPNTVVAKLPVNLHITFEYLGREDTGARAIPCNPQPRSLEADA